MPIELKHITTLLYEKNIQKRNKKRNKKKIPL